MSFSCTFKFPTSRVRANFRTSLGTISCYSKSKTSFKNQMHDSFCRNDLTFISLVGLWVKLVSLTLVFKGFFLNWPQGQIDRSRHACDELILMSWLSNVKSSDVLPGKPCQRLQRAWTSRGYTWLLNHSSEHNQTNGCSWLIRATIDQPACLCIIHYIKHLFCSYVYCGFTAAVLSLSCVGIE